MKRILAILLALMVLVSAVTVSAGENWDCGNCGATNGPSKTECWRCGVAKSSVGSSASSAAASSVALSGNSYTFSEGEYTVGRDIPAGTYTVTVIDHSAAFSVWKKAYHEYSDGGMLYNECLIIDENPTLNNIVLKDGYVIYTTRTVSLSPSGASSGTVGTGNSGNLSFQAGQYTVGTDIPAGTYTVTVLSHSTAFSAWKKAYQDYSDGGLLYNKCLIIDENPSLENVVLEAGNIVYTTGAVQFIPSGSSSGSAAASDDSSGASSSGYVYGHTDGSRKTLDDGTPYIVLFGTGADNTDPCLYIFVEYADGTRSIYALFTVKTNVLDALTDCGLIKAEKVSWGYSVTTVDTVKADYYTDGAWWGYYTFENGSRQSITVGLETVAVESGDSYYFMYSK